MLRESAGARGVRVLIVDDSNFAKRMIAKHLSADQGIEIIGYASDGRDAIEKVRSLNPDVVTLDLQMPGMDGLTALRHIMAECPVPVVVVSSHAGQDAQPTIEALELGAVDFFLKPSPANPVGVDGTGTNLAQKVKQAAKIPRPRLGYIARRVSGTPAVGRGKPRAARDLNRVVVIGASTGGPRALCAVVPVLPADIPAAILIVQHMPPEFTGSLAKRLGDMSQIAVREARTGDSIQRGLGLVAPGGFHMVVTGDGDIGLNQDPLVCNVRPSVDVTMQSVTRAYGARCLGVVLTGMGSDGSDGAAAIKAAGGGVVVEAESTCTVYGMPKSVVDAGNADKIVPLHEMAEEIVRMCAME